MKRSSDAPRTGNPCADALEAPPEPVEIERRLRELILDRPQGWHAGEGEEVTLSDWLWEQWAPALTAWGVDRSHLGDIVGGYRQELWLWLMGERTWAHTVEGLVGRIRRRAPTSRRTLS